MATLRQYAGPQSDPPTSVMSAQLEASLSYPGTVDVSVCEWTADMSPTTLGVGPARTTVVAVGFVDFDAIESVRTTSASKGRGRP